MTELLDIDDSLLPLVRDKAQEGNVEAHRWLLDSARRWAITEFMRREDARVRRGQPLDIDDGEIDRRMQDLALHQVAVLTYEQAVARPDAERVYVGFLDEDSNYSYLRLWLPGTPIAGLFLTRDVFELPSEYRVGRWPHDVR